MFEQTKLNFHQNVKIKYKYILSMLILFGLVTGMFGQYPNATSASDRIASAKEKQTAMDKSMLAGLAVENVGPTVMSGRVSDVAVNPNNPAHFYVAYSSGGLWETKNNGTTFHPIFDHEIVMTIGDIEVDWQNEVIYLGSGEVNSSRSSYAGVGMYKSSNNGDTWEHIGLDDSHHIGRILIHPTNPNILWVAALGHLYSQNEERGVFKSEDGGNSWKKTLYINDQTGVVDLVLDPNDANTLYAGAWDRDRKSWNFVESGVGSGIYKSTDGGNNWSKISGKGSGFPDGDGTGRIGLDIGLEDGNAVIYALLDNYNRRPKDEVEETQGLSKNAFKKMSAEELVSLDNNDLQNFLEDNNFPDKYSAKKVKKMVRSGKIEPKAIAEYLEDANSLLFDTPVIAAEVYKSTDGGKTWEKTHTTYLDGLYNSYGYYFGQIRVAPYDANQLYLLGVPILRSDDGGKTFENINGQNVHADHHALWINPALKGHIINGNDGGINISYDYGESWVKCNSPAVGQFYAINVDMAKPYKVYGGLQDNGVWMGSRNYSDGVRWHNSGQYPYQSIMGGDGMQVEIDTRDNTTVYTGFQFGNYFRINTKTKRPTFITPKHELGDRPYRFNWQSPIALSSHNQDILYLGGNKLLRSLDQGNNFKAISPDLTKGGKKGDVAFGTLTSISESDFKFGLIYTGSDDGLIYRTMDGGNSWTEINTGLPDDMWVSRVQASSHHEATVYLSLNGYRWDDFSAYLFVSTDYGDSWRKIGMDLPLEPINVVKEDPENGNILYVGTDHGLYISLDKGENFMPAAQEMPAVPVHDVVVHPRDRELVIGTHGRSIYVADVSDLQDHADAMMKSQLIVFKKDDVRHNSRQGAKRADWAPARVSSTMFSYFTPASGEVEISIMNADDVLVHKTTVDANKGFNYYDYDLKVDDELVRAYLNSFEKEGDKPSKADDGNYYCAPASYNFIIKMNNKKAETGFKLKAGR